MNTLNSTSKVLTWSGETANGTELVKQPKSLEHLRVYGEFRQLIIWLLLGENLENGKNNW